MFKEVKSDEWIYSKDGDFIEGTLVKVQSGIGENKSMLYNVETANGIKSVWGSAILDSRMGLVKIGDKIRITYKGKAEAKSGKNPAKIFKVEVDK